MVALHTLIGQMPAISVVAILCSMLLVAAGSRLEGCSISFPWISHGFLFSVHATGEHKSLGSPSWNGLIVLHFFSLIDLKYTEIFIENWLF